MVKKKFAEWFKNKQEKGILEESDSMELQPITQDLIRQMRNEGRGVDAELLLCGYKESVCCCQEVLGCQ